MVSSAVYIPPSIQPTLLAFTCVLPQIVPFLIDVSFATKMRFSGLALSASAVAAAPFSYPLADGFPKLNSTAMAQVFALAGGTTPNSAPPSSLKANGVQTLQLIAANEIFEVAYFTELLANVTNNVPGYEVEDKDYVVRTLTAVVNVRLHLPCTVHSTT